MQSESPRVIVNDAIVVLCLKDYEDTMSHHNFRLRAKAKGFHLTNSQCHNMLHRAMGRVGVTLNGLWKLTVMGVEYRREVIETLQRIVA